MSRRAWALPINSGKGTRLDEAREALLGGSSPLLKSLSEKYEVRFFELGESLKAIQGGDLSQIKPGAKTGDLNEALRAIAGKNHFALLFSDGNMRWENRKPGDLPLLAYPLGSRDEYRDVLVKSLKAPAVAFRGKEVVVDAVIKGYGYEGLLVPVILKSGEKLLATKRIRLQSGTGEAAGHVVLHPRGNRFVPSVADGPAAGRGGPGREQPKEFFLEGGAGQNPDPDGVGSPQHELPLPARGSQERPGDRPAVLRHSAHAFQHPERPGAGAEPDPVPGGHSVHQGPEKLRPPDLRQFSVPPFLPDPVPREHPGFRPGGRGFCLYRRGQFPGGRGIRGNAAGRDFADPLDRAGELSPARLLYP